MNKGGSMKPFLLYLIGVSGSGKTTISKALEKRLVSDYEVNRLQVIDGDMIRNEFGDIFGYTFEERMRCNRAVCVVCSYLLRNNISVILAQVGAYKKMRNQVRECDPDKYVEVYVKCSNEECARRDVKGYFKKVNKGQMTNLNGINDTFEVPDSSDVVIDTEQMSVEECVETICKYLESKRDFL